MKIRFTLIAALLLLTLWSTTTSVSAASPRSAPTQTVHSRNAPSASNAILRREVLGFVNASKLGDPSVGYQAWDFRLLTTVAYFAFHINVTDGGIIGNDTGWYVFHSQTMTDFVNKAHANSVRVIVSINQHSNPDMCNTLSTSVSQTTIGEVVSEVQKAGIDGVNINYEGQIATCADGVTNRAKLVDFTKRMRAALPQGAYLAIDTYTGSAEDNLEFFDVTGLAPYVNSMFVMAYDSDGDPDQWSNPPLSCTQMCMSPVSPLNSYRFNVTKAMQQYTALVPSNKVILGQPYYGRTGCVSDLTTPHQTVNSSWSPTYLSASTLASQSGVHSFASHRDNFDGVAEWDTWYDSDIGCNLMQYFDDVTSLAAKYDVVNQYNLRGVGFFTLDYGGGAPELWHLIENKFATTTPWYSLGGVLSSNASTSSWGASRTDVFVRGSDNALWHRSFDGSTWSAWESLGGTLTSNPAAVSWGPNRVDVFVRGTDGALWHRSFDGTTWSAWDSIGGIATSGPSAGSWGANRMDIVVRGTNGGLWHRAWTGSAWGSWDPVGGVATSDPSIVGSGTGRVDVFVRGTDNALWHRSGDGAGSWNSWESIGGVLTGSPAASSCSPGHLDVFVQGTDHAVWQVSNNGTPWNVWTSLRGYWTASPAAVCTPATTNVSLFERGPDYALWQTVSPGT